MTGPAIETAAVNDVTGDAPVDTVVPQEPGTPSSIGDASRAFRERIEATALAADAAAASSVLEPTTVPDAVVDTRQRNPDGTFKAAESVVGDSAGDPALPADATEPAVFVLKGEPSRGESDIELDVAGLPAEVLERLERSEKQGMRRAEYDKAMGTVRTLRSDLDAVETEIAVDPEGFFLHRIPAARQASIAKTMLFQHWDALAPIIEQYWQDDVGRLRTQQDITNGVNTRRSDVMEQVQASRDAAQVRAVISNIIPDGTSDADADEFFASAISILQQKARSNELVTAETAPALLSAHRRRFFGAAETLTTPPVRPKIAVRTTPPKVAPVVPPVVASQADIAARHRTRLAALATAPQGAGAGAVQRPGGPPDETIEQASKRIRAAR